MPDLDEYRISELDPVLDLSQDDLMEVSVEDDNAESGYVSHKSPLSQLGAFFVNILQYVTSLKTGSKTVTGAINQTVSNFANDYDSTSTYAVDDCVIYGGVLYKCNTAITTAEAWDATHWTQIKAVDVGGGGNLADLGDVNINMATLANGQVIKYDAQNDVWYNAEDEGAASASDISFDPTASGLVATDVQDAIDEVNTKIANLPDPMVFRGTVGTGGTITTLPVDGSANVGDTYKVLVAGTYAGQVADVGDTFICMTKTSNANTWSYIPSGDEPDTLDELEDTNISGLADNDVLGYNATSQKWTNRVGHLAFKDLEQTLAVGSTTVTFQDAMLTDTCVIQEFVSAPGVQPLSRSLDTTTNTLTYTFLEQSSALTVMVRLSAKIVSLGGLHSSEYTES